MTRTAGDGSTGGSVLLVVAMTALARLAATYEPADEDPS
jgi:hypothetical protein